MVYSVAGLLGQRALVRERPFRAPHHTVSVAGLAGGGPMVRPGEISLAHNGVLFLDELLEFSRPVLETLRQPLEERSIAIVRARRTVSFPASFQLVAATNPCPCGHLGNPRRTCTCSQLRIESYRARLSGPLLDRIDLHVARCRRWPTGIWPPGSRESRAPACAPGSRRRAPASGPATRARTPRLPTRALAEVVQLDTEARPPAGTGGGTAGAVRAGHRSRAPGGPHHRRSGGQRRRGRRPPGRGAAVPVARPAGSVTDSPRSAPDQRCLHCSGAEPPRRAPDPSRLRIRATSSRGDRPVRGPAGPLEDVREVHLARPPIATERLSLRDDGRLELRLKRPWRDGTTAFVFRPHELIERLVAIVPRPRAHLVRYSGVLAPAFGARAQIVPCAEKAPSRPKGPASPPESAEMPRRPGRIPWAPFLWRFSGRRAQVRAVFGPDADSRGRDLDPRGDAYPPLHRAGGRPAFLSRRPSATGRVGV